MARWLDRPRVYPHRCIISHKGDVDSGPYFEFEREYYEHPADDATPARLYLSHKYLMQALKHPDAPVKIVTEEQHEAVVAERDDMALRLEELEAECNLLNKSLEHERDVFARARVKNAGSGRRRPRETAE